YTTLSRSVQLPPRHRQVARRFRAAREHDRVELLEQLLRGNVDAHMHAGPELDALGRHLRHAAVDLVLLELEVGNAVAHQPADPVLAIDQPDLVSRTDEL